MSTYVLIHGAWHGAWCWERVVPMLERAGHRVRAPDLPGHGKDRTPTRDVTLQGYADRICRVLDAATEPVVLVGHSMGGIAITEAAERRPEKVRVLAYVSAFLLRDGETLVQIASGDREALVMPNLVVSEDQASATLRPEAVRDAFYGNCAPEDAAHAQSRLVPQALGPFQTPVRTTPGNWGRIPRVYIGCARDRAITPPVQQKMCAALPCRKVVALDTDHSPFYSAPRELADHLLALAS
jgi:pimeloyl-ACP methyl ester carboxylesterase